MTVTRYLSDAGVTYQDDGDAWRVTLPIGRAKGTASVEIDLLKVFLGLAHQ
jgi:hypothetical protein